MSLFCAFTVVYRSSRYSLSFPFWNFRVIQQSYLEHCQFVHHYHQHHNYPLYQNHHNINTTIIIAIITTSIYFITAISFVLTINTIYIIITTIITATLSFIIIIIISSKLRNSAFCYYHCEYNDISLQAPLVILLHSHHKSQ